MSGPRRVAVVLTLCALGALLASCRPLYVPLVPDDAPTPLVRTRLADASALTLVGGRPQLTVVLGDLAPEVATGEWLDVQWFAPSGAVAASESRWVDSADLGLELVFELPSDVETGPGEWRAVASLDGFVLRQFRVAVEVDPSGDPEGSS